MKVIQAPVINIQRRIQAPVILIIKTIIQLGQAMIKIISLIIYRYFIFRKNLMIFQLSLITLQNLSSKKNPYIPTLVYNHIY
jgi:hypothetical protein